jgi:hypothetical protein
VLIGKLLFSGRYAARDTIVMTNPPKHNRRGTNIGKTMRKENATIDPDDDDFDFFGGFHF